MHIAVSYGGLSQVPAALKLTLVEGTEMASRRHLAARGYGLMHEARSSGPTLGYVKVPCRCKGRAHKSNASRPLKLNAHNKNTNKTTRYSPHARSLERCICRPLCCTRYGIDAAEGQAHSVNSQLCSHQGHGRESCCRILCRSTTTSAGIDQNEAQRLCKAGLAVVPAGFLQHYLPVYSQQKPITATKFLPCNVMLRPSRPVGPQALRSNAKVACGTV